MTDVPPPATVTVMARANLTIGGYGFISPLEVATVPNTAEVQACIAQDLLVAQSPDGTFADLGPIDRPALRVTGCCGGNRPPMTR